MENIIILGNAENYFLVVAVGFNLLHNRFVVNYNPMLFCLSNSYFKCKGLGEFIYTSKITSGRPEVKIRPSIILSIVWLEF